MKRHEMREFAFMLVFEGLFRDDSDEDIIGLAEGTAEISLSDNVIALFKGTREHGAELDEIISTYSQKRLIDRIPKVNMAILRIALHEILFDDGVPQSVAINEAVLLAKKYAADEDVAFVNGVLGSYSRSPAGLANAAAVNGEQEA